MSFSIQMVTDGVPVHFSLTDKIHPAGGWSEQKNALAFARQKDAQAFIDTYLRHQAELCKIIPHEFR